MNIDKSNFNQIYPEMISQIKECDFLAFDLEYSGIKLSEQSNYSLFDSMEDRYQHVKSCSTSFTTFQLGIVLFTRVVNDKSIIFNTSSKFIAKTYNINIFPTGSDLFDTNFTCSAAALKFLRTNHMNINDIIDKGVGFLNKEEFSELKSRLDSYSNVQGILSEEQQKMLDNQRKHISDWLAKSKEEILKLPIINRFSPYFQQMYFRSHFTDISTELVDDHVIVKKVDALTRFAIDQKEDDMDTSSEKYKFCIDMLGVSKIWKLISRLKKPIVGHNCLFDLITIYQKFFANLPDTFEDFRFEMHKVLPTIYDTKFIFGRMRVNFKELAEIDGGLQTIFNSLSKINHNSKDEALVVQEDCLVSVECRQAHEAGYDSFMTGCCLLFLANMIYRQNNASEATRPSGDDRHNDLVSKRPLKISVAAFETYEALLRSWKNQINVIKAHQFSISMETGSGGLTDTRPPFFVVYDRSPRQPLVSAEEPIPPETEEGSESASPPAEIFFSQAFLEQLLFEFGHADVRPLGPPVADERRQKFLVAMSGRAVARVFSRAVRRRWPRLTVREYHWLADHEGARAAFLTAVAASTLASVWAVRGLIRMI